MQVAAAVVGTARVLLKAAALAALVAVEMGSLMALALARVSQALLIRAAAVAGAGILARARGQTVAPAS